MNVTYDLGALQNLMAVAAVIIGLIAVVIGLIALVLYVKDRKAKKPRCKTKSYNIIRDFEAKSVPLDIRYLDTGEKVENVTVSKVAFWNAGNDTLEESDVAKKDPITLRVTNGCKILYAKRIFTKNDKNEITIEKQDESCAVVKFEFIEKGEGAVFELGHTGKSSDDVSVCGTVKGGVGSPKTPQRSLLGLVLILLIVFMGLVAFIVANFEVAVYQAEVVATQGHPPFPGLPYYAPLFVFMAALVLFFKCKKYARERLPKGFSAFEEEIVPDAEIEKPRFGMFEILTVEGERKLELREFFTPDELKTARIGLDSIFPEAPDNKPRNLWVRTSVPSHQADLSTLASKLGRTLWVESVGTISVPTALAAGQ